MKEVKIVEYNNEFRESAINLLKTVFSGTSHEANFAWRFENDNEFKPIIVCAVDAGAVISFQSWIKWAFEWQGKTYIGYQNGEAATDPNYRRMGIWWKLMNLGEKIARKRGYIDFFFAFPSDYTLKGSLKAGYYHVGTYNKNIRIINPFLLSARKEREQNALFGQRKSFFSERDKVTPIVDSDYIDWRYYQNPKVYRIINYYERCNVATFILRQSVYHNKRYGIKFFEVQILDCHFTSYNKTFVNNSFKYLDSLFSRKAAWMRTFVNEKTEKGKALKRHFHYRFRERGGKLIFKKINLAIDNEPFYNFENWDLQPHVIDSE